MFLVPPAGNAVLFGDGDDAPAPASSFSGSRAKAQGGAASVFGDDEPIPSGSFGGGRAKAKGGGASLFGDAEPTPSGSFGGGRAKAKESLEVRNLGGVSLAVSVRSALAGSIIWGPEAVDVFCTVLDLKRKVAGSLKLISRQLKLIAGSHELHDQACLSELDEFKVGEWLELSCMVQELDWKELVESCVIGPEDYLIGSETLTVDEIVAGCGSSLPQDLVDVLERTQGRDWLGHGDVCRVSQGILYLGSRVIQSDRELWFIDLEDVLGNGNFSIWHARGLLGHEVQPIQFWLEQGDLYNLEFASSDIRCFLAEFDETHKWPCQRHTSGHASFASSFSWHCPSSFRSVSLDRPLKSALSSSHLADTSWFQVTFKQFKRPIRRTFGRRVKFARQCKTYIVETEFEASCST